MTDHIVERIRSRRKKLLKDRYGNSVERFVAEAVEWQKTHSARVVSLRRKNRARAVA